MNSKDIEQKVWNFLKDKGISRQTLLEAADFFQADEKSKEESGKDKKFQRGRPVKIGLRSLVFYLYYQHKITTGKIPTIRALTVEAEKIRELVLQKHGVLKFENIDEFRSPVNESTVKNWVQNFKKIQEKYPNLLEGLFKILDLTRQIIEP